MDHMQLKYPVYTSELGFPKQHKQVQSGQIEP